VWGETVHLGWLVRAGKSHKCSRLRNGGVHSFGSVKVPIVVEAPKQYARAEILSLDSLKDWASIQLLTYYNIFRNIL